MSMAQSDSNFTFYGNLIFFQFFFVVINLIQPVTHIPPGLISGIIEPTSKWQVNINKY